MYLVFQLAFELLILITVVVEGHPVVAVVAVTVVAPVVHPQLPLRVNPACWLIQVWYRTMYCCVMSYIPTGSCTVVGKSDTLNDVTDKNCFV